MLFVEEPRWAPVLRAYEADLFDRRHPYRQRAEIGRLLVRRGGDVVGRCCVHRASSSTEGWFGAFECTDDAGAVRALIAAAGEWVAERGATTLRGPATFTLADEAGVQVTGFEHAGGTGRPWHPPWYVEHLVAAGLALDERAFPRWRLASTGGAPGLAPGGPLPPQAGKLADPRIVLAGAVGAVAAVPDIAPGLRARSVRQFRQVAGMPDEAAVVRVSGPAPILVPAVLAAAGAAGYRHVWAPWSPDDRPPDTVHRVLRSSL